MSKLNPKLILPRHSSLGELSPWFGNYLKGTEHQEVQPVSPKAEWLIQYIVAVEQMCCQMLSLCDGGAKSGELEEPPVYLREIVSPYSPFRANLKRPFWKRKCWSCDWIFWFKGLVQR